jgi:SAM-dependent methyltransferase
MTPELLKRLYEARLADPEGFRPAMWKVLCEDFFQADVPPDATVVEMAAGHCEFINAIRAGRKVAADINPAVAQHAAPGVEVVVGNAAHLPLPPGSVDVVFMSNFLEHLDRTGILDVLRECLRLLKPGGRLLILQPNQRFVGRDYWMFFDHITPVDDRALCEVLGAVGFEVTRCIPRFLPFTTRSRIPKHTMLVRAYLRVPILWRAMGAQAYVVARRPGLPGA